MHFGETSVFIAIASVLHAMTIKPALDELGKPSVGPTGEDVKMKKGFLTYVSHSILYRISLAHFARIRVVGVYRHPEVPGYIFEARNQGP